MRQLLLALPMMQLPQMIQCFLTVGLLNVKIQVHAAVAKVHINCNHTVVLTFIAPTDELASILTRAVSEARAASGKVEYNAV